MHSVGVQCNMPNYTPHRQEVFPGVTLKDKTPKASMSSRMTHGIPSSPHIPASSCCFQNPPPQTQSAVMPEAPTPSQKRESTQAMAGATSEN